MKNKKRCNHSPSKSDGVCRKCNTQVYTGLCGICGEPWKKCTCKVAVGGTD